MDNPLVSIVIPVYNVEQYLPQCLDSVLDQTYTNIEVICVNDGSTDSSLNILKNSQAVDKRIHIIDIQNRGVSNARNVGLSEAKGEWVMFVDSDDWLEVDCLEILLQFIDKNYCDIVMFPYVREKANLSLKRDLFKGEKVFEEKNSRSLARRIIGPIGNEVTSPASLDSYGTIWGKLYHRSIIDNLEFVDLEIIGTAEDSLFNMFAFKRAKTIAYCPDVYYHYRRNVQSSLTSGSVPRLLEKWKVSFSIISNHFTEEEERTALSNRIALGTLGLLINAYQSTNPIKEIRQILNDDLIHQSLKGLNTSHLSIHWKLFYSLAKSRQTNAIKLLIFCIQRIRLKKNS